ncbi:LysE family translocator [Hydrogenophaga sp. 5NK40-0174]|uniref:LysE family translocator n=1 Tax=Hydrogenophaga sp. 5NK40-0174 TaxID=3127649 RepID=UPI0031063E47
MPDLPQLLVFIVAGWLLNLTPGPDVLYIITSSLKQGVRAGMVAALGIVSGCMVHVVAAAVGLSALMSTSTLAFNLLKWCGAAYLLYIGVRALLSSGASVPLAGAGTQQATPESVDLWSVYRRGFLTNVLNPKVALFFLAFVPQFIAHDTAHKAWVFLALGVIFNVNSLPINFGYAWLADWATRRSNLVQRGMRWLDRVAGCLFIGFGIRLALTDNPSST